MTNEQEQALAAAYGPAAQFSEHHRGDHVTYREAGATFSGIILWVAAPVTVGSQKLPLRYIVEPEHRKFVDIVWPADVVTQEAQEPTLARCPYCGHLHQAEGIEQCPLKPK